MSGPAEVDGPGVEAARTRLLFITADPSWPDHPSQAAAGLIDSILAQARHTEVAVRLTERPRFSARIDQWRSSGAEVRIGPLDPADSGEEWGTYSHVLMTWMGGRSCAREWVRLTQPQAARILYVTELPWRGVEGPAPAGSAGDRPGLEGELASQKDRWAELGEWADAVWCQNDADAEIAKSWFPGTQVAHIPAAIQAIASTPLWPTRKGVVIGALGGYDYRTGADEAAVEALSVVAPILRRSVPEMSLTLVADGMTAGLAAAAKAAEAEVVDFSGMDRALAGARVAIARHEIGTGQRALFEGCMRTGTPFVADRRALGGLVWPDDASLLPEGAASSAVADLAQRLLLDREAWSEAARVGRQVLATYLSPAGRAAKLAHALAGVGITPGRAVRRRPALVSTPESCWNPRRKDGNGLRPPGVLDTPPTSEPPPDTPEVRYQAWARRHEPTGPVSSALLNDIGTTPDAPTFSVLMPVFNTDPVLLDAAVASVRAQIYDRWELCIGNDGSDRGDTLSLLAELRGQAGIKVVDRLHQGGISAATNTALSVAKGDYVAFLDHDDCLKPHALAQMARWIAADPTLDVVYSDEDILDAEGKLRDPHLKPDWSPDQLLAQNYVCHLTVARRSLVEEIGGLRPEFDGSQDYDLILRLSERTHRIGHVPEPLYSWRAAPGSFAADPDAKPYAVEAGARAIEAALGRRGYEGRVETLSNTGLYRAHIAFPGRPRVSIVIPTKDRVDLLSRCIDSIRERSTYRNYEIVVVDNQTTDPATQRYLAEHPGPVIRYPYPFNYARLTNLATGKLETDALLFLNNDTEVITPEWIEAMLEHAMRPEVGAVGARLYFGDGRVQHEGIMIGTWGDWATNVDYRSYFNRGAMVRNTSAVTGACCMIRPSAYHRVGGSDPRLRVAYNDVDLCLRLRRAGYEIVYTPHAELRHHEGSSRGDYQHHEDAPLFRDRWDPRHVLDPYYSPVFSDEVPFEVSV